MDGNEQNSCMHMINKVRVLREPFRANIEVIFAEYSKGVGSYHSIQKEVSFFGPNEEL